MTSTSLTPSHGNPEPSPVNQLILKYTHDCPALIEHFWRCKLNADQIHVALLTLEGFETKATAKIRETGERAVAKLRSKVVQKLAIPSGDSLRDFLLKLYHGYLNGELVMQAND